LRSTACKPDLFRALKEAGFAHLDPGEIIEAKINGVRAESLHEAKTFAQNLNAQTDYQVEKSRRHLKERRDMKDSSLLLVLGSLLAAALSCLVRTGARNGS